MNEHADRLANVELKVQDMESVLGTMALENKAFRERTNSAIDHLKTIVLLLCFAMFLVVLKCSLYRGA